MRLYEALFLIEAGRAAQNFDGTEKELHGILEKHGAKIRDKVRFEERKLAYTVRGNRRGAYLLTYFDAEPAAIHEITTDLNLSEFVLRTMIIRWATDQVPEKKVLGTLDSRPDRPEIEYPDASSLEVVIRQAEIPVVEEAIPEAVKDEE